MTILEYLEHPTSRIPSTIVDKIYYSLNYNDQLLVFGSKQFLDMRKLWE